MFYSNTSLIIPTLTAMLAFVAWGIVANRVRNLCFPIWLPLLIVAGGFLPLAYAMFDLYMSLYWASQEEAVLTVVLKTVLRSLEGVVAYVVYKLLALAYPERMLACPVEPSPKVTFPRIMDERCRLPNAQSMAR